MMHVERSAHDGKRDPIGLQHTLKDGRIQLRDRPYNMVSSRRSLATVFEINVHLLHITDNRHDGHAGFSCHSTF